MAEDENWNVHEELDFTVQGFRVGDRVAWHGEGTIYKIEALLQNKYNGSWYAFGHACDGSEPCNFGLGYIKIVGAVDALADVGRAEAAGGVSG